MRYYAYGRVPYSVGRPWQYDRKVVHDEEKNCYIFVKDGIKHTLVPMKEEDTTETSGTKALLIGRKAKNNIGTH